MSDSELLTDWEDDQDSFFDVHDAARLTLTPPSTLRRWIANGVVVPSRVATDDDDNEIKGFSLRDLAFIRIIRHLTDPNPPLGAISLQHAVESVAHAVQRLSRLGTHWADAHLVGDAGPLVYVPDQDDITKALPFGRGQRVFEEFLDVQLRRLLLGPESLLIPPEFLAFVEMNPRKREGHPVVRGTNIETAILFELIGESDGVSRAHSLYPFLTAEALLAVEKFHSEYLHDRREVPTG